MSSASVDDPGGHLRLTELHELAAAFHERAAALHDEHVLEIEEKGWSFSRERAKKLAGVQRERAENERRLADNQRVKAASLP